MQEEEPRCGSTSASSVAAIILRAPSQASAPKQPLMSSVSSRAAGHGDDLLQQAGLLCRELLVGDHTGIQEFGKFR